MHARLSVQSLVHQFVQKEKLSVAIDYISRITIRAQGNYNSCLGQLLFVLKLLHSVFCLSAVHPQVNVALTTFLWNYQAKFNESLLTTTHMLLNLYSADFNHQCFD